MKTFSIDTLGCKVNQYEGQQIREFLERLGLTQIDSADKPDVAVVNTCCVTNTASAKSRQYIRRAKKFSPDAAIVVSGCLPLIQAGQISISGTNIHLVNNRKNLAGTLTQIVNGQLLASDSKTLQSDNNPIIRAETDTESKQKSPICPKLSQLSSFKGHTRAFLKIQDGCDAYCSYCIIPKIRPIVHSRPVETILQEAQILANAGHKEIVITGIFLGAYGEATVQRNKWPNSENPEFANLPLRGLLEKIAKIPNLPRIRLSSLEPGDVTPRLLDIFCKYPNIMPHLHLPLQSGSPAILKKMRRQYTIDEFVKTVELVKARLEKPAITTDIIVGFPGETDADFQQTVDLTRFVGFAKMHVFAFSPQKGTSAAKMPQPVDSQTIKHRSKVLRDLDNELGSQFRRQFLGQSATVLIEDSYGQMSGPLGAGPLDWFDKLTTGKLGAGRSERYFMVYIEKTDHDLQKNELVKVSLTKNTKNGMVGVLRD